MQNSLSLMLRVQTANRLRAHPWQRTLFTATGRDNTRSFDYSKMSDEQIYANLNKLKSQLPVDEYKALEQRIMAPYRLKNRAMGVGLVSFCLLVFGYAAYRTKTEDFRNIEPAAK
ncbi:hypothetical protein HDU81_008202 [Chytriomyces hyalinus]|nr:hypothetical protein HDU81_008202 [Chytriomyces hyalinus]